jgi:O-antigen ligase
MFEIADRPDRFILGAVAAQLAALVACSLLNPALFGFVLAASVVVGILFLALCFPTGFCVAWLLVTSLTLEMTLHDLVGEDAFQPAIAAIKGVEILLGVICVARFGLVLDPLCPAWAFLTMTAVGLAHGLYPGLTATDSVRSMVGSVAPFVFCFVRVPQSWSQAMIRATKWAPITAVVAGIPFALIGLRPLFVDSGGARLAGLGHPAFLAGVCLPAIYACLIQLYRDGRRGDLALLITNFAIIVLTGARAPTAYAVLVTAISLASIRSRVFAASTRRLLVLSGLAAASVLFLLADELGDIRLINVALNETSNLSGREFLWPSFQNAAAQSPWFGWGIGAGNAVISPQGRIAQMLHTWAAHNEYLRMQVEGGLLGEALLVGLFAAWTFVHTRRLPPADRRIMRLAFIALAGNAITDNVLISTPACVMFAFAAAVFARRPAD